VQNLQRNLQNKIIEIFYKIKRIEYRKQNKTEELIQTFRLFIRARNYIKNCLEKEKEKKRENDNYRKKERKKDLIEPKRRL
jgi:hypothetical protein